MKKAIRSLLLAALMLALVCAFASCNEAEINSQLENILGGGSATHTHEYQSVVSDATCTKPGFTTYTCSCGYVYVGDYTEAIGHNYKVDRVVKPTDVALGYTVYKCDCGVKYNSDYVSATSQAVGIAGVQMNDGKLVIDYTDGTSVEIDMPSPEISNRCKHENVELGAFLDHPHGYELVWNEHVEDYDKVEIPGKYLSVCTDCGFAEIVEAFEHSFVEVRIDATCTDNALTCMICTVCGYMTDTTELEDTALGHDLVSRYAEIPGMNICTDGVMRVDACENCGYAFSEMFPAIGHKVSQWFATFNPTVTETGTVKGLCEQGCNVILELPELDESNYSYSELIENWNCATRKGVGTYTIYVAPDGELFATATEGATELSFEVALIGKPHTLNGALMTERVCPSATDGIVEFVEFKATCETDENGNPVANGNGYYTCEACNVLVPVATYKEHTYKADDVTVVVAAECETKGLGTVKCDVCCTGDETVYVVIPAPGHNVRYDVRYEPVPNADNTYNVIVTCEECDYHEILEIVEITIVDSTCTKEGTITVKLENGKPLTVKIAKKRHTLNGEDIDPAVRVLATTVGVTEFADDKATCVIYGGGYYYCDACGEIQLVTTYAPHTFLGELIVEQAPTCEEPGWYEQEKCDECESLIYGEDDVANYIPALGHDYKFVVCEVPDEYYEGYAIGTCQRVVDAGDETTTADDVLCGDIIYVDLPALDDEYAEYVVEALYEESCQNGGKYQYTYSFVVESFEIKTAYTVTFTKGVPSIDHTFNGSSLYWTVVEDYIIEDYDTVLPFDAEGNPLFVINEDNEFEMLEDVDYDDEDIVWVEMSGIVWVVTCEMYGRLCDDCGKVIVGDFELLDIEFKEILVEE